MIQLSKFSKYRSGKFGKIFVVNKFTQTMMRHVCCDAASAPRRKPIFRYCMTTRGSGISQGKKTAAVPSERHRLEC
jgi:hypothetical protein